MERQWGRKFQEVLASGMEVQGDGRIRYRQRGLRMKKLRWH